MATYNGAVYLREQLDSFAAQTRLPDELIIGDDGSDDDTIAIARAFANDAPFNVRISSNSRRLGYSANFERAITRCSGDIIFLSDQDDVWFPNRIERILSVFEQHQTYQCVINGQILTDSELRPGSSVDENLRALGRTPRDLVIGAATSIRGPWAKLLFPLPRDAVTFFSSNYLSHDRWVNELSEFAGCRKYVRQPLQYWRRHGANVTDTDLHNEKGSSIKDKIALAVAPTSKWRQRIAVLDVMERFVRERNAEIDGIKVGASSTALRLIGNERRAHELRIKLYEFNRISRVARVARLALTGGYSYFNGARSVITDIFRR